MSGNNMTFKGFNFNCTEKIKMNVMYMYVPYSTLYCISYEHVPLHGLLKYVHAENVPESR